MLRVECRTWVKGRYCWVLSCHFRRAVAISQGPWEESSQTAAENLSPPVSGAERERVRA